MHGNTHWCASGFLMFRVAFVLVLRRRQRCEAEAAERNAEMQPKCHKLAWCIHSRLPPHQSAALVYPRWRRLLYITMEADWRYMARGCAIWANGRPREASFCQFVAYCARQLFLILPQRTQKCRHAGNRLRLWRRFFLDSFWGVCGRSKNKSNLGGENRRNRSSENR